MARIYIPNRKKTLANRMPNGLTYALKGKGEDDMSAMRKRAHEHEFQSRTAVREIPPADYSDEVTAEQIETAKRILEDDFKDWKVVDGPAW